MSQSNAECIEKNTSKEKALNVVRDGHTQLIKHVSFIR